MHTPVKLTMEERETMYVVDPVTDTVTAFSTLLRKQGWHLEDECHYGTPDGPVIGARFSAPERAISIRNPSISKRVLSEAHLAALRAANPRTARGPC